MPNNDTDVMVQSEEDSTSAPSAQPDDTGGGSLFPGLDIEAEDAVAATKPRTRPPPQPARGQSPNPLASPGVPGEGESSSDVQAAPAAVAEPTLFDDLELKPEAAPEPLFPFAILADWSVVLLCVGLALVCACVIIPQADANRRLVYEREKLQRDLAQIQKQHEVNQEFLRRVEDDPQLAERLAMRQMKMVPRGMSTLDLNPAADGAVGTPVLAADSAQQVSPFVIVNVPPPSALSPYRPLGGILASICLKPQAALWIMAGAIMMIAIGLVLGPGSKPKATTPETAD